MTTVIDSMLGDEVTVLHSYLTGCEVRAGGTVGPFAYLRPDALLREGAKAGTFVEIKNSDIGEGTKVPHLSYVGDTEVGPGSNLGAATITANYDGRNKHRTTIGAGVRTSRRHDARRAHHRRRRGLHGRGIGRHRGRPAGRAGHRTRAPDEHRGLRGSAARQGRSDVMSWS